MNIHWPGMQGVASVQLPVFKLRPANPAGELPETVLFVKIHP